MSAFFPNINLDALRTFAISTAANEHRTRNSKVGSGRSSQVVQPRILSCQDVHWGGDKMIMITFDPESLPLGPRSMMAHFPQGRPHLTTQALVGMTATIRAHPLRLVVPQVYSYIDYLPNDIGAEVVLLQKITGEPLNEVWPTLNRSQEHVVISKVAEILLALFNYRGHTINTDLEGSPTARQQSAVPADASFVLAPAFDQGPLASMPPQPALNSIEEYLRALAGRIERVFTSPEGNQAARDTGHSDNPRLNDQDVERIRDTWKRLARLIPFHIGGFYLPDDLSPHASSMARSVLQSPYFGICHGDMKMSRFIVDFQGPLMTLSRGNPNDPQESWQQHDLVLGLTGWEHAYRAPLWSCARMPKWLYPRITPDEVVSWERQSYVRQVIVMFMTQKAPLPDTCEWVTAHVYGTMERWFEGCLSSHWKYRNTIELLLTRLKVYWHHHRPGVAFPLPVGPEYASMAPVVIGSVEDSSDVGQAAIRKRKKRGKAKGA